MVLLDCNKPTDFALRDWHHQFMKLLIACFIAVAAFGTSSKAKSPSPKLVDPIALAKQWEDEILYFKPSGKTDSFEWNGVAYNANDKLCYQLVQKPKAKKVESTVVKCETHFLNRAIESYEKFESFQKYRTKFTACLGSKDKECLRRLISKTVKISFGDEGYGDRRDIIFATWKESNYERVKALLAKGVISEGDYKRFPPDPEEDGVGYRGHFENKNGSWVLASFVTGD